MQVLVNNRHLYIFSIAGICALLIGATSAMDTQAVAPSTNSSIAGQALEIAPPVVSLKADPGQTLTTQISVRNVSKAKLVVSSDVNDFTTNNREDGSPVVLGLDENTQNDPSPYSIVKWISSLPKLQLTPNKLDKLPVTIRVPKNAAPGGYFGVVRFTASAPDIDTSGVSLSASLGALIFIRVNGEAKESVEITEFSASRNGTTGSLFDSTPITFTERVKNTGTVYEPTVGRIGITDMFGKKVANINVNLEGRYVLPGSTRKFTANLDKSVIGDRFLFGMYTATLTTSYGSKGQTVSKTITFFILPWQLILSAVAALLALIIAFRFWLKRHDSKVSGGRSRRRR